MRKGAASGYDYSQLSYNWKRFRSAYVEGARELPGEAFQIVL